MAVREKFDPNGPYAPRAEPKPPNELDPTKCVAAQLGATGNERQCTGARIDGEWCERHSPETRARWRLERQTTAFQDAVKEWQQLDEEGNRVFAQRDAAAERINVLFAEVAKEQQLLAGLPWQITRSGTTLFCKIKDERVGKFLDRMEWENISWHHTLKIGETYIYCNDGDMEITFQDTTQLVAFCKAQGITPDVALIQQQYQQAQQRAQDFESLIKEFE